MKTPIGLIIKDLIRKNNFSVEKIASQFGSSRQDIYYTYRREHLPKNDLEKWAGLFEISVEELEGLQDAQNKNEANIMEGVFDEIRKEVAEIRKTLKEKDEEVRKTISEKDEQIRSLHRLLELSMGKPLGEPFLALVA